MYIYIRIGSQWVMGFNGDVDVDVDVDVFNCYVVYVHTHICSCIY